MNKRVQTLFDEQCQRIYTQTDRAFAALMPLQWVGAIAIAYIVSPLTWAGSTSQIHFHVWLSVFLGGAITLGPVFMIWTHPGKAITRHVVAAGQVLMSALLIHLTGGRIETHFHVFGSLAFLSCYRDWRVLITSSAIVAIDHLLRGLYWPQSVFGVLSASSWRWVEHAAWVIFEGFFLIRVCWQGVKEMWLIAERQAQLENINEALGKKTAELTNSNDLLKQQMVERQRAEWKLKRSTEQLKRSNNELQDFASVASHDLQEPLRKVQVFGDRLKTKCIESLGPDGRDYLERMQGAATRMQTLIDDLLSYSRVTSKAQPFVAVDLRKVAAEVVSDLEVRIEQVGGRVEIGALPMLQADPLQMRQLLQNLVGNALKFHRKDAPPAISIFAEVLDRQTGEGAQEETEACRLFVKDNGIGFDEKYTDRIFKVFERLHGREEYEGTGMGLAICRKIAERHGGTVTAKSVLGEGTVFIVTLPYQQTKGGTTSCATTDTSSPSLSPTMTPTTG